MHYIVAYDIRVDRRRQKVMNTLKNYGTRVQFSVFECEMDRPRLLQLAGLLRALINKRTDRIHIFPLCESCYFRGESYGAVDGPVADL